MATFAIDLISGNVFLFVPDFGGGSTGTTSGSTYPEVNTYAQLPAAAANNGETYLVRQSTGDYVLNRKEAGFYFSNGSIWYRLGDIPSFFDAENFQVYNSSGTSGIEFVTSGITGTTFRQFTWQDKDGTVALLTDLDTKVDKSIFDFYTGTTAPATYLKISDFGIYSATTEVRLTNIENSVNDLSGKTKHYDGIDTEANILALSASTHLGELWYAVDTDMEYKPFSISTTGTDEWIAQEIIYDPISDTYKLGTTADGQTQNLGQEIFVNAHNESLTGATALNPKVFITTGVHVGLNGEFSDSQLALAGDIGIGSTYGINTTDAGVNDFFKITTYGFINDVNTSSWVVNTELFISDLIAGELTDVKPANNPIVVGIVKEQNATTGKIFVNTIRQVKDSESNVPLNFQFNYFTGDIVTGATGLTATSYFVLPNDKGTVPEITLSQTVGDNTRADLLNQFLSPIATTSPTTFNGGIYDGEIQVDLIGSVSSGNEKIYVEVYYADSGGTALDSGISAITTGFAYPLKPIVVLESSLLSLSTTLTSDVFIFGTLLENFTIELNHRLLLVVSVEKVGTGGGTKTFDCHFGTDYNGFIRTPFVPALGDLSDVNTDGATQGNVIKYNSTSAIWVASTIEISDVNQLQSTLDDINNDILYISGVTDTKQDKLSSTLQLKDISGNTEVNTISKTPIIWTTEEYSGTSLNFSGGSRIYIQETASYEISYLLNVENQSGSAKVIGTIIRKNGSTDVTPLSSASYSRNNTNDSSTNTMPQYKVDLDIGDYLELMSFRIGSSGSVLSVPDGTWIKIEKIT